MLRPPVKVKNRHQLRTEETQSKILKAAEAVFSKRGVEKTRLEDVAVKAGYTRGAIYAHYSDKEDLFLAMMKHRVLTKFTTVRRLIRAEPEARKRADVFKRWIVNHACDHSLGTLILEFKLYALRKPRSRAKLESTYNPIFKSSSDDLIELLFGDNLDKITRADVRRRLAIVGAILSAVILESEFRPKLLPKRHLRAVLEELCDALIHSGMSSLAVIR